MRTITENTSTNPPPCPAGIDFEFPFQSLDRTRPEELTLLGTQRELLSPTLVDIDLQISGIDLSQVCSRDISGGIGGEILQDYWRQIDFSGGLHQRHPDERRANQARGVPPSHRNHREHRGAYQVEPRAARPCP